MKRLYSVLFITLLIFNVINFRKKNLLFEREPFNQIINTIGGWNDGYNAAL